MVVFLVIPQRRDFNTQDEKAKLHRNILFQRGTDEDERLLRRASVSNLTQFNTAERRASGRPVYRVNFWYDTDHGKL
jgi:hypothetical protein